MKTLGISTSSKAASVALMNDDGSIAMLKDESAKAHSVLLMPMLEKLLEENAVELEDIDLIAVDIGPGSFTGVRIGVSTANALAFAVNKEVCAVSSLAALSHAIEANSRVFSIIDAKNGNCYAAAYDSNGCVMPEGAYTIAKVASLIKDTDVIVGDCFGGRDMVDARLVILASLSKAAVTSREAVPMYLRPSQAERNHRTN